MHPWSKRISLFAVTKPLYSKRHPRPTFRVENSQSLSRIERSASSTTTPSPTSHWATPRLTTRATRLNAQLANPRKFASTTLPHVTGVGDHAVRYCHYARSRPRSGFRGVQGLGGPLGPLL